MKRPLRIAVCGGAEPDAAHIPLAEEVGARLAEAGAIVICGGRGGLMEAAARGAHAKGGTTVGMLPGRTDEDANGYVTLPIPTGLGEARDLLVVTCAHAVIAVGGEWGTLAEIAFASKLGRPVVLLAPTLGRTLPLATAHTPEEAVRLVLDAARESTHHG